MRPTKHCNLPHPSDNKYVFLFNRVEFLDLSGIKTSLNYSAGWLISSLTGVLTCIVMNAHSLSCVIVQVLESQCCLYIISKYCSWIVPCTVLFLLDFHFIFLSSIKQSDALNSNQLVRRYVGKKIPIASIQSRAHNKEHDCLWHAPTDAEKRQLKFLYQPIRLIYELWASFSSPARQNEHPLTSLKLFYHFMCLYCICVCVWLHHV